MYEPKEISRISQNLSLRLSPERKYVPKFVPCRICCCCPCRCCDVCHCFPCHCCTTCHFYPCNCFLYHHRCCLCSPLREKSPMENTFKKSKEGLSNTNNYMESTKPKTYNKVEYEQKQFNDLLSKLMSVEGQIERIKSRLALNPDFNCEDAFRLFESDDKGYLDIYDIKNGLKLLGVYPTKHELNLFMKRFDLQNKGAITYADFFDIVVPFEKESRQMVEERKPNSCCPCVCPDIFCASTISALRELFNYIIQTENEINNMRRTFGTLRLKLKDIFGLVDTLNLGYFSNKDLIEYLKKEYLLDNNKNADLLFIRLDKNRNGKIDFNEVEDEVQTLY